MSDNALRLPEAAVLVVLMAEAREISNPELKTLYGVTLDGKSRLRMNDMKLVDSWKERRAFVHVLTDAGWARMGEEIREGTLPVGTGSSGAMVRALVTGLRGFLRRDDFRLADVFQPNDSDDTDVDAPEAELDAAAHVHVGTPVEGLETRIRAAYLELAGEYGQWVDLGSLRPLLGDATKAEVDRALVQLERAPDVNLVPQSNQKILTAVQREAAVNIGDQDKHLLWIGAL
ncbi:hypothetical protein SAMN05421505_10394 [Sinosporangium album]|uniref:Uncharacterized protein n=1 Tax=Sinosporangium album TaxID=504805 RepID=A0A1G7T5Q6_9ACTN|nr:hypothetical protein [Sinosporangium album]SDG29959.1 hypothetical protein SAMN05421505_10394 [Sinosporangium album]